MKTKEREIMDRSYLNAHPKRREEGLIVREVDGELVVYDLESHEAHCLNPEAARLWQACDGSRDGRGVLEHLHGGWYTTDHEAAMLVGLQQLGKNLLLEDDADIETAPPAGTSRRELLARFGKAAAVTIALPTVISIMSPTPAEARSCTASNLPCESSGDCCSGLCKSDDRCL